MRISEPYKKLKGEIFWATAIEEAKSRGREEFGMFNEEMETVYSEYTD